MHIKRQRTPKTWKLKEIKSKKWVTKGVPGPHSQKFSLPINLVLKEIICCSKQTRESKWIVSKNKVLVNKKVIKTIKFPVGLFDSIELKDNNEIYRLTFGDDRKFTTKKIKAEENGIRPCKVISKTIQKKGVIQINLDNGMNLLTDKKDVKVGDTLVVDLSNMKVLKHLKFGTGALVMIIDGKYVGRVGTLKEIKKGIKGKQNVRVMIDKDLIETLGGYAFVLDSSLIY